MDAGATTKTGADVSSWKLRISTDIGFTGAMSGINTATGARVYGLGTK